MASLMGACPLGSESAIRALWKLRDFLINNKFIKGRNCVFLEYRTQIRLKAQN